MEGRCVPGGSAGAPGSLGVVLGGKEAEIFYAGASVTRGLVPKGQPGCRVDQSGSMLRKSKSEADQAAVGRGKRGGRVRSMPAAREGGGGSWGPCALCSQASTVRPGVTEALPLRMGTGHKGQT